MRHVLAAVLLLAGVASTAAAQDVDTPPEWLRKPSAEELQAAWPAQARVPGGQATIVCVVTAEARMEACEVDSEEPAGQGFGEAALMLAPSFVMKPGMKDGRPVSSHVRIPITFTAARELDTDPEWLRKPSYEELEAAWPYDALRRGQGGEAVIICTVTVQATLEACEVDSEEPEGQGFGAAALLLVPSFVIKPGTLDGRAVSTRVGIPISFSTQAWRTGSRIERGSVNARRIEVVTEPVWEQAPDFAELMAAWPERATADFGHVAMRCRITSEGRLGRCEVLTETPVRQGFADAARKVLAPKFRMRVSPDTAEKIDGAYVNLPVRFVNPADPAPPSIVKPKWITQLDPEQVAAVYPAQAAEAGITTGRGVADCVVAADGGLSDCKPAGEEPEGYGFAQSAVLVASVMRMNPWSDGGGPVDGVRLRLPITFNLAPETPAAP